jgi:hypothetical protein
MKSINWFLENGCELQKPDKGMLIAIHGMSRGNPCSECNCKDTCPAWQILQNEEKQAKNSKFEQKDIPVKRRSSETNAQFAKRLGISKRQASKIRQGQYYVGKKINES